MSEAKHEASRKCTPSPTSYFYPYSLRRKIKMAIIKDQPNAYLQRSSKRQSNSKSKQTLGEMCRCSNTSSHVQDLFGLRNFTICYEYWLWIRPINDGYVTIMTRILFTRPKRGLSETPFERKIRVTWRVTHSSTKLPMYFKKLDSKKYINQVIATFNIHN